MSQETLSNAERHAETLGATLGALDAAIATDERRVERLILDSDDALHRTRAYGVPPNSEAHRDRWDAVTAVLNEAAGLVPGIKAKMDEARGVQGEMAAAQAEAERKAAEKAGREAEKARRAALTPAERRAEERLAKLQAPAEAEPEPAAPAPPLTPAQRPRRR